MFTRSILPHLIFIIKYMSTKDHLGFSPAYYGIGTLSLWPFKNCTFHGAFELYISFDHLYSLLISDRYKQAWLRTTLIIIMTK